VCCVYNNACCRPSPTFVGVLPSFLPSFLPYFLPSFLPSFLSSFLPSFPPSFLPSFPPSFLPSFLPSCGGGGDDTGSWIPLPRLDTMRMNREAVAWRVSRLLRVYILRWRDTTCRHQLTRQMAALAQHHFRTTALTRAVTSWRRFRLRQLSLRAFADLCHLRTLGRCFRALSAHATQQQAIRQFEHTRHTRGLCRCVACFSVSLSCGHCRETATLWCCLVVVVDM